MYTLIRTRTAKPLFSPQEDWYSWDKDRKEFDTLEELQSFLKEEYPGCKRVKSFRDTDTGAEHTGWIYCYNTPKCTYDDCAKNNQDWIEVYESNPKRILF